MSYRQPVLLRKDLSFLGVFSIATGATLSSGLFLLPGIAAAEVGPAIILCYMLAVVPLVPAAFSIVELSTAMPRAGGAYYFLDRSLGPLAGSVGGIGTWLALTLKTSFALIGMGAYVALLIPESHGWGTKLLAVVFALVFGLVNWWGAHKTGAFQIMMVVGLLAILGWFTGVGLPEVKASHFEGFFGSGMESMLATAGLVYISYVGVTKVASISEEVRDPERNLPLGIFVSLGVVLVVYALCTVVMVGVLPLDDFEHSLTPMADAALNIGGRTGEMIVVGAALIAFASVANAGIFSASRYPLAMSRDHLLPTIFRRLNSSEVPSVGIALTVGTIALFLLVLDPLKIAKLASTFQLLMFGLLCFAVIVMRESRIDSYDPGFRSPLYPWMQIFGMIAPLILIGMMGWPPILFSSGLVALGVGWYYWYARDRVTRHGAIYHVFERLGRERFEELDVELRGILKEKGLRAEDPFDEIVARAIVLDYDGQIDYDEIVDRASEALAPRVPSSASDLARGFVEGTRTGATPVSRGVALPHMRIPGISSPEMVLVRSRKGVDIEVGGAAGHITRERSHAIFFLVSPEEDPARHLRLLANLASHVDEESFLVRWLEARREYELRQIFLSGERYLSLPLRKGTSSQELIGKRLYELDFPEGALIALVHREGKALIPRGSTLLRERDRLLIIGEVEDIAALKDRYVPPEEGADYRLALDPKA